MTWAIMAHTGAGLQWAQWVDEERFVGWQARLRALWALPVSRWPTASYVENADPNGYVRLGMEPPRYTAPANRVQSYRGDTPWTTSPEDYYRGQASFLLDVWTAVAEMLRAVNQPAYACPSWVQTFRAQVGTRDPASGLWLGDAVMRRQAYRWIDATNERARSSWANDGMGYGVEIYPRLMLTAESTVASPLLYAMHPPEPPAQGPFSPGVTLDPEPPITQPLNCLMPGYAIRWPAPGGPDRGGDANYLPSLDGMWEMTNALVIGGEFLARDAKQFVNRSRQYTLLKNISEARRFRGNVPEDLIAAAAAAEEIAHRTSRTSTEYQQVMGQIGQAVASANPIAGAAIQGIGYAGEILEALGGRAVARTLDEFGRVEPVYESATLGGTIGRTQTRPAFTVPPPPPVDLLRYPLTVPQRPMAPPPFIVGPIWLPPTQGGGAVKTVEADAREKWGL